MTAGRHPLPRILHVLNALDAGGMERTLLSLVAGTSDRFDHVICTLRRPGPLADRLPVGATLVSLGVRAERASAAWRLARVVRSYRPALIHARGWGVWADAALGGVLGGRPPLILSFHGLQSDAGFGRRAFTACSRTRVSVGVIDCALCGFGASVVGMRASPAPGSDSLWRNWAFHRRGSRGFPTAWTRIVFIRSPTTPAPRFGPHWAFRKTPSSPGRSDRSRRSRTTPASCTPCGNAARRDGLSTD